MHFLTEVPVHFINNVTPLEAGIIVFCATTLGVVMGICAVLYLILRKLPFQDAFSPLEHIFKKAGDVFVLFITASVAYIASVVFKNIFILGRPAAYNVDLHPLLNLTGYGFPSSHATFYGAIAITIFFMNREAGYVAIFFALVIGTARVLAGVHSPADILGGYVLALLVSSLIDFIVEKLSNWRTA